MNLLLVISGVLFGLLFIRYVMVCRENQMLFYKISQAEGCISNKVRHHLACWRYFAEIYGYKLYGLEGEYKVSVWETPWFWRNEKGDPLVKLCIKHKKLSTSITIYVFEDGSTDIYEVGHDYLCKIITITSFDYEMMAKVFEAIIQRDNSDRCTTSHEYIKANNWLKNITKMYNAEFGNTEKDDEEEIDEETEDGDD